ncbi:hypothetical protein LTR94_024939, partial [Friedmanniomyces endolithicus]
MTVLVLLACIQQGAGEAKLSKPPQRSSARIWRVGRRLAIVAGVLLLVAALALAALYLNRRAAARQALVGWLEQRGIQSEVEVERIELDGFVGKIRIGDPRDPDVVVERVEVDYAVAAPWSKTGLAVQPSRIRLVRPVLRASFQNGKLSLGSLDPLLESFKGGPPRPDARSPLVIIETGQARIDTDYGRVALFADARVDDGKLMRLAARMPAQDLKSGAFRAEGLGGVVDLTTKGDRVSLQASVQARQASGQGLSAEAASLQLNGELPYPDLKTRRGDGRAVLEARVVGSGLGGGGYQLRDADLSAQLDVMTTGWIETFRIQGAAQMQGEAAEVSGGGLQLRRIALKADPGQLTLQRNEAFRWSYAAPISASAASARAGQSNASDVDLRVSNLSMGGRDSAFEATGEVASRFGQIGYGDLQLRRARGDFDLDLIQDGGVRIQAEGSVRSEQAAWPIFGPVGSEDLPDLAQMKRALSGFSLKAPAVRFSTGSGGTSVELLRPVTAAPSNGGVLTIVQGGDAAYGAEPGRLGLGALRLAATRGQGLPELSVSVPKWRLTETGFEALLDGEAKLDFDLAHGVTARTRGLLAMSDGRLTYVTPDCVDLSVERLELDENDVHQVSGSLCPGQAPLFASKDGVWRLEAGFRDLSAQAPFLGARVSDARGQVTVNGARSGIGLNASVEAARLVDTIEPRRFEPLSASGRASLDDEIWSGAFDLKGTGEAASTSLGHVVLAHDGATGQGGVQISAPDVSFVEGGLQPSMLSPLVDAFIQTPVTGTIGFDGRFDWTKTAEPTSSGVLTTPGLDFVSPVGPVRGLRGEIELTSLTPIVTAPDQRLTIDSLEVGADATALDLVFAVSETG